MTGHLPYIAFTMPGGGEWIIILIIGLLIFGRRLPEVARSLGKSVNEFKRGLRDFEDSAGEVVRDVNKIKDDVVAEAEKATADEDTYDPYGTGPVASGPDEYGSYDAEGSTTEQDEPASPETGEEATDQEKPSQQDSAEPTDQEEPDRRDSAEPAEPTSEQDDSEPYVDPMK